MKLGEIWRVRMPAVPGHTQAGERPAIIVQESAFNSQLPTVLIIPFTSNLRTRRFPGTYVVQPDQQNGLTVPSVALVFQQSAVDQINCLHRLGTLDPATLDQVFDVLDQLMGR